MVKWIHLSILILTISICLPQAQSLPRRSTVTSSPPATPTKVTTTTADPWANYDYVDYDEFETTTTRSNKNSITPKVPKTKETNVFPSTKLTNPVTTSPLKSKSTPETNILRTTTALPPKIDPTEKGVTKPLATIQPEVALPPALTPPPSTKISLAREYADRSHRNLENLKVELNYNQYIVATATYLKAGEMLNLLQQSLTNLLGAECRKTEFPNFYQPHIPLPVSAQHHPSDSQGNKQDCTTSRGTVNQEIKKFEQLIHINTKYQEQTTTVQENLVREMESLHKSFQENLENTFGDYAHGEPHERLLAILREESLTTLPVKDASVTKRPPSSSARNMKTPSIAQKKQPVYEEPDLATTLDLSSLTTPLGFAQEIGKNAIDHTPAGPESIEAVEITGGAQEIFSIQYQFYRIESSYRGKNTSEKEKVHAFINLIDQVEEAGLNENPEIFELAVLIKNCQGHALIVPYVKHLFPAQVQYVVWGMKNHLKMLKNDTKFKVYADTDYNVQSFEILNSNSSKFGDAWKFIPMNEGKSFVLYNIDRNSVLKAIPAQNATLTWPTEAGVTMETAIGRDVTMLAKRSEYLWQLTLNCKPTEKDSASAERTRLVDKDFKCYAIIESQFYTNLALNFNRSGYMSLQDKRDPGLFIVENVN